MDMDDNRLLRAQDPRSRTHGKSTHKTAGAALPAPIHRRWPREKAFNHPGISPPSGCEPHPRLHGRIPHRTRLDDRILYPLLVSEWRNTGAYPISDRSSSKAPRVAGLFFYLCSVSVTGTWISSPFRRTVRVIVSFGLYFWSRLTRLVFSLISWPFILRIISFS